MPTLKINNVKQAQFIYKIEKYLHGRGRENNLNTKKVGENDEHSSIEGLCNGASLLFLERIFYDCLNRFYLQKHPSESHPFNTNNTSESANSMDALLKQVLTHYFNEVESIIAIDDDLLDSQSHQQKLKNRKSPEYLHANKKLGNAINSGELLIPAEVREKFRNEFNLLYVNKDTNKTIYPPHDSLEIENDSYALTLIALAKQQGILTEPEAEILKNAHIPDIAIFERFISQIVLLQSNDKKYTVPQSDMTGKFSQLLSESGTTLSEEAVETNVNLPLPVLEFNQPLRMSFDELEENLDKIFPNERLALISLPEHTVAAFKINNKYYYYDSNNSDKNFVLCENGFLFICKLGLSQLMLSLSRQTIHDEKQSIFKQAHLLSEAIKLLEKEPDNDVGFMLALDTLPELFGLEWKTYQHPNSPTHTFPSQLDIIPNDRFKEIMERTNMMGESILHDLAHHDELKLLNELLSRMDDVETGLSRQDKQTIIDAKNLHGDTALYIACTSNHIKIVNAFLEAGADANFISNNGISPLSFACEKNNFDCVKALIKHNANVNQGSNDSPSPFIATCMNNKINEKIFDAMLPSANVDDSFNGMPVLFICMHNNNYQRAEKLLLKGADPNAPYNANKTTWTPLSFALHKKQYEFAECLLKNGAVANSNSVFGNSLLMNQIENENLIGVRLLLKYGATLAEKELNRIIEQDPNNVITLFVQFPAMAHQETKASQIGVLFEQYAQSSPSFQPTLFSTNTHCGFFANQISKELLNESNKNLDDHAIRAIIMKHLQTIPGGREKLEDAKFSAIVNLILDHYLAENAPSDTYTNENSFTLNK